MQQILDLGNFSPNNSLYFKSVQRLEARFSKNIEENPLRTARYTEM